MLSFKVQLKWSETLLKINFIWHFISSGLKLFLLLCFNKRSERLEVFIVILINSQDHLKCHSLWHVPFNTPTGSKSITACSCTHSFDRQCGDPEHGCAPDSQHQLCIREHKVDGCAKPIVIFFSLTVPVHSCHRSFSSLRQSGKKRQ